MVPLAIGNAMSTLVALSLSEKKYEEAKIIAFSGLTISAGYEVMTMLVFTFVPTVLLSIYTDKKDVILVGSELIFFAALFQIPDGIQATLSGILRGMSITRPVMILTIIGYWVIGLPLGAMLAYKFDYGAKGLWMGLAMSLSVMAITLFVLFLKTTKDQMSVEEVSVA
jgi:MATE family multidrug resistance protein